MELLKAAQAGSVADRRSSHHISRTSNRLLIAQELFQDLRSSMIGKAERGVNGTDEVYFRGSPQGDWLKSTTVTARMLTLGAWRHAEGFDTITAYSRGGKDKPDTLILNDTPGVDTLKLKPLEATLTTPDYKVTAYGFGTVEVTGIPSARKAARNCSRGAPWNSCEW